MVTAEATGSEKTALGMITSISEALTGFVGRSIEPPVPGVLLTQCTVSVAETLKLVPVSHSLNPPPARVVPLVMVITFDGLLEPAVEDWSRFRVWAGARQAVAAVSQTRRITKGELKLQSPRIAPPIMVLNRHKN